MMMKQMQQDQVMHTLTNKRPFYSIIIPCYNSRPTIERTLESIYKQHLPYLDIQVVLSDDCSTESYQDIVDKYKQKLYITQVKTDYNKCPGNTRQRGVDNAKGQWVMFMDHDDQLMPDALRVVKEQIEKNNCDSVILTSFYKKEGQYYIPMPQNAGWTHGKIFNLDNFWKKYNLHYVKDMISHEDVCLSTEMEFIRTAYNIDIFSMNIFTYIWIANPDSLSNKKYVIQSKERVFIDAFFIDYVQATAGIAYQFYKNTGLNKDFVRDHLKKVLLYSYFYNEYARYKTPQILIKNCDHIRKYLFILLEQFNESIDSIYNFFAQNDSKEYREVWKVARGQIEEFLYEFTFKQWLYWIKDQKYLKA